MPHSGKTFARSAVQNGEMSEARVLVVDDEPMVRDVLYRYLQKEGFEVDTAEDGELAILSFEQKRPDLVLLDLMLPQIDGLEVFRRMRQNNPPAVIMLTAKGEETDRIVGLELGADDYIVKPFSPREVVARVRAVLRRTGSHASVADLPLSFDGLVIDPQRRTATLDGEPVRLTRKEFDLLELLASNANVVFSRTQLLEQVWDFAWAGDASTVTVHIRRLRQKIEKDPSSPVRLVTVWGVGYRFEA